ncbi:MAG: Malonyl-CoA O-methyltransferase BioC [Candidatus Moranbacteria bacterium GW2011_GWF2_34_56]|nr:MAG: Malonyl-CoA O-methyltransferase BioC [Candidatus Moranbacteria bacterium GW2011_GWF1_34_10]KKP65297.1 MAG: Malonyl-CoA O-methyltransferase BioC [Candidatus Moranbacteria bacterium GW2011_GWF2_34_56]HBI17180.1 hypothetical protein [Candidatus Moranbacteria bacterium]
MEKINPIGDIYKKDNTAETYYDVVGKNLENKEYREADELFNNLIPKSLDNKIVLDLGCGNGIYAEMLCERGAKKVVAVDLNEKMLKKAQERKDEKNLDQLDLVLADMDNLPVDRNKFDFIFSRFSLVHTSNLEQVMKDLSETLVIGGEILIGTNVAVIKDSENNSDIRRKAIPIIISINGNEVALEDFSYTLEDYLESFDGARLTVTVNEQFPADDVLIDPNFPKKDIIKFNYGIFKLRKES